MDRCACVRLSCTNTCCTRVFFWLSSARIQAEKLWLGYLQQSELSGSMVLTTFWAICEAVLQGDVQAAEFADMTLEEYVSYGTAAPTADFSKLVHYKKAIGTSLHVPCVATAPCVPRGFAVTIYTYKYGGAGAWTGAF